MANNLRALRKARGLTQRDAATALGTALSQYAKLERGDRRLTDKWIERAASAYQIDSGKVVSSAPRSLPVLGSIEATGAVRWHGGQPPVSESRGALIVTDGALGPLFDGAQMVTRCRRVALREMISGRPYLVLTGERWLLRTVKAAGGKEASWHLTGFAVAPIFDAMMSEAIACEQLQC